MEQLQEIPETAEIANKVHRRVLVVDDQAINRKLLEIILSRFGVEKVVSASQGLEALMKLKSFPECDLVLTDIRMPRLSGLGLVRKLREDPAWAGIPVYAVTSYQDLELEVSENGFNGVIFKPVTPEKLSYLVNDVARG